MTIDPNKITQAKEWSKRKLLNPGNDTDGVRVAQVITALPDEWIDPDKLREILTGISNGVYEVGAGRGVSGIAEDLRALLSAPAPLTNRPMFPDEAKDYLNKAGDLGIAHHERHALETVAGLGTEEYPYLVNTDTNGGLYEPAMRVRLVGRWIDVPKKPKEKP